MSEIICLVYLLYVNIVKLLPLSLWQVLIHNFPGNSKDFRTICHETFNNKKRKKYKNGIKQKILFL